MIRYIFLLCLTVIFCVGFFLKSGLPDVIYHINDKVLHSLVFYSYIIIFYFTLNRFKHKLLVLSTSFLVLSYLVEYVQPFFDRSYSTSDFRYSILGTSLGISTIVCANYLKYLLYASKVRS